MEARFNLSESLALQQFNATQNSKTLGLVITPFVLTSYVDEIMHLLNEKMNFSIKFPVLVWTRC